MPAFPLFAVRGSRGELTNTLPPHTLGDELPPSPTPALKSPKATLRGGERERDRERETERDREK